MKALWYLMAGTILLASCGNKSKNFDSSTEEMTENHISDSPITNSINELLFKGNLIRFEKDIDNKKFVSKEIEQQREDIRFRANWISTEYYLKGKGMEGSELEENLNDLHGEQLFFFEFTENQRQDLLKKYYTTDMDKGVSYLSFNIQSDFSIINANGDTLIPNYSIYERNFHVAPYERVLLSFSGILPDEGIELHYNDNLFQKGKMVFSFPGQDYLIKNTQYAL